MRDQKLLTLVITRRYAAAAYLVGTRLEHVEVRRLETGAARAEGSVRRFVSWLLGSLAVDCAAIAPQSNGSNGQKMLWKATKEVLMEASIPIELVDPATMLRECAQPPFNTMSGFGKAIASFWPVLADGSSAPLRLQAAGLGIYVQTRRQVDFIINASES
jgi:hypothetical protein